MNLTKEYINAMLDSVPAPYPGIVYEFFWDGKLLTLIFYRDNFNRFPDDKQVLIAEWIQKLVVFMNDSGIVTGIEFQGEPR